MFSDQDQKKNTSERDIMDALNLLQGDFYLIKNRKEEIHNCRDKIVIKDFSALKKSSLPFLYWAVQCK